MRACGPRAWDSVARQLTNRQPTNQTTSKATNQQTNKPTNRSKINQKSTKNPPKIDQKSTKIGLLEALGGLLEGSWVDLGLKSQNMSKKATKRQRLGPPTWHQNPPKSGKIGSKSDPKGDHFFDWLCGRVLVPFGTQVELGRQNPPKIDPSWSQNPSKKGSRC